MFQLHFWFVVPDEETESELSFPPECLLSDLSQWRVSSIQLTQLSQLLSSKSTAERVGRLKVTERRKSKSSEAFGRLIQENHKHRSSLKSHWRTNHPRRSIERRCSEDWTKKALEGSETSSMPSSTPNHQDAVGALVTASMSLGQKLYTELTTTDTACNGRINGHCILIKVF